MHLENVGAKNKLKNFSPPFFRLREGKLIKIIEQTLEVVVQNERNVVGKSKKIINSQHCLEQKEKIFGIHANK
jgi:hypothetical protein